MVRCCTHHRCALAFGTLAYGGPMALDRALAFSVLAATMVLFIWGRLRYELVAVLALLAAVVTGVVP